MPISSEKMKRAFEAIGLPPNATQDMYMIDKFLSTDFSAVGYVFKSYIGLVFCSAAFGYDGGITAGIIMLFYTLFFYSTEHSFIHFTEQSIQNVFVSLIGIFADLLLVCSLKYEEIKAFKDIKLFTEKLEHENENLQVISMQDCPFSNPLWKGGCTRPNASAGLYM